MRAGREESGAMTKQGQMFKRRRERLHMSVSQLARLSGVHRTTLSALEDGAGSTARTINRADAALSEEEAKRGLEPLMDDDAELIEIEVDGDRVILRGRLDDSERLAELMAQIQRNLRQ